MRGAGSTIVLVHHHPVPWARQAPAVCLRVGGRISWGRFRLVGLIGSGGGLMNFWVPVLGDFGVHPIDRRFRRKEVEGS